MPRGLLHAAQGDVAPQSDVEGAVSALVFDIGNAAAAGNRVEPDAEFRRVIHVAAFKALDVVHQHPAVRRVHVRLQAPARKGDVNRPGHEPQVAQRTVEHQMALRLPFLDGDVDLKARGADEAAPFRLPGKHPPVRFRLRKRRSALKRNTTPSRSQRIRRTWRFCSIEASSSRQTTPSCSMPGTACRASGMRPCISPDKRSGPTEHFRNCSASTAIFMS